MQWVKSVPWVFQLQLVGFGGIFGSEAGDKTN
jgi:hypothetical protein